MYININNINEFNVAQCEKFLRDYPNHELADAVRKRLAEMRAEFLQPKTKWMDINELLEKKRYWNLSLLRNVFLFLFLFIFIIPTCIVIYYTTTEHEMYREASWKQEEYVGGVERIALLLDLLLFQPFFLILLHL